MVEKLRVSEVKFAKSMIGMTLPTNKDGHAGRFVEEIFNTAGMKVNRGAGVDLPAYDLEIKSREITATSAHTIADMSVDDIIAIDYKNSPVYEKIQRQFRVHTKDNVVVSAEVYDFSSLHIQHLIELAYEHARQQLIQNPGLTYTPYIGFYGYFEKVSGHTTLSFRMTTGDMRTLERMTKSNYKNLFSEGTV